MPELDARRRRLSVGFFAAALIGGAGPATCRADDDTETGVPRPASAAASGGVARFSLSPPGGAAPAPWAEQRLRDVAPNRFTLVDDDRSTVLQIDTNSSASSLVHPVVGDARAYGRLRWRWKVSAYPANAGFGEKAGDDYAARVYVMFDYPLRKLPLQQRLLLGLARTVYGEDVPAAALCYVIDPRAPAGTVIDSPYTARVKMIVVRSEPRPGRWWEEERDLEQDFARTFGAEHGPGMPPIKAIALASDTDQRGARLQARFGDVQLSGRPGR